MVPAYRISEEQVDGGLILRAPQSKNEGATITSPDRRPRLEHNRSLRRFFRREASHSFGLGEDLLSRAGWNACALLAQVGLAHLHGLTAMPCQGGASRIRRQARPVFMVRLGAND